MLTFPKEDDDKNLRFTLEFGGRSELLDSKVIRDAESMRMFLLSIEQALLHDVNEAVLVLNVAEREVLRIPVLIR